MHGLILVHEEGGGILKTFRHQLVHGFREMRVSCKVHDRASLKP